MSEQAHSAELKAFEQALQSLAPQPTRVNRDRLMFRAGQRVGTGCAWRWPVAMGSLAALALAAVLWFRPAPQPVVQVVYVPVAVAPVEVVPEESGPAPAPLPRFSDGARPRPPRDSYLQLREYVTRWGADALPHPPATESAEPRPPVRAFDRTLEDRPDTF